MPDVVTIVPSPRAKVATTVESVSVALVQLVIESRIVGDPVAVVRSKTIPASAMQKQSLCPILQLTWFLS